MKRASIDDKRRGLTGEQVCKQHPGGTHGSPQISPPKDEHTHAIRSACEVKWDTHRHDERLHHISNIALSVAHS